MSRPVVPRGAVGGGGVVETVQGLVTAETIRVRNGGLKTVLKGARVNPLVFSNKPRHR